MSQPEELGLKEGECPDPSKQGLLSCPLEFPSKDLPGPGILFYQDFSYPTSWLSEGAAQLKTT